MTVQSNRCYSKPAFDAQAIIICTILFSKLCNCHLKKNIKTFKDESRQRREMGWEIMTKIGYRKTRYYWQLALAASVLRKKKLFQETSSRTLLILDSLDVCFCLSYPVNPLLNSECRVRKTRSLFKPVYSAHFPVMTGTRCYDVNTVRLLSCISRSLSWLTDGFRLIMCTASLPWSREGQHKGQIVF